MSRLFRVTVVLLMLIVVGPGIAAVVEAAEESTLVVDLAEGGVVEEHTARLLWNLMTDNLDLKQHPDVVEGWNSLYLEQPEAISGQVVVDFETGTITGEIIERWTCSGDCRTSTNTPSWTTTRDTGWTAVIADGVLEPDGDGGWEVTGSVAISYDTKVTAKESPSDCGGTPCYVCTDRVCEVGGTGSSTASLEGWIEGRTLSLAFADGLEANIAEMDFSDLRRTEFYRSRFSITVTPPMRPSGSTGSAEEPTGGESGATRGLPSTADRPAPDLPAGQIIPGLDAGSPPSDFSDEPDPVVTSGVAGEDEAADAAAEGAASDAGSAPALLFAILIVVLVGAAVWLATAVFRRFFGTPRGRRDTSAEALVVKALETDAPDPDPHAPVTQPTGEFTGTVEIREAAPIGTAPDGTAARIPQGVYPAGQTIISEKTPYVPINMGDEILWVKKAFVRHHSEPELSFPKKGSPQTTHPGMSTSTGPTSPVYLAKDINVRPDSGPVQLFDPKHKFWKGEPLGGRTPIYDKDGKLVGTVDTAELQRSELKG